MSRLLPWTAPALLSLALLSGCATTSHVRQEQEETQAREQAQEVKQSSVTPAPKHARRVPPKAQPEPKPEPVPAPPLSLLTAEVRCKPGGGIELHEPSERPADVVPFNPGTMSAPRRISGPQPLYTAEALAERIQGVSLVRCILNRDGVMRSCRILKPLPPMDEVVVSSLCESRYEPATLQGQPVDVEHTFNTRLELP